MLGAIAGDIIGSIYEFNNCKTENFKLFTPQSHFTDDTVLTIAIADALTCRLKNELKSKKEIKQVYKEKLLQYGKRYPTLAYGQSFNKWLNATIQKPYKSFGNGSAMRISPIGFAFKTLNDVLNEAKSCAEITHNHPEGIKGAQCIASVIFQANNGIKKDEIKSFIKKKFKYNLDTNLNTIRENYAYEISCQMTIPQALIAFFESYDYEDAIRKAISIGGDSDTIACITGGIAHAYYKKIPEYILNQVFFRLDIGLKKILKEFNEYFHIYY